MSAGLRPDELTQDEINLLKEKFGEDWFEKLGYGRLQSQRPN